MPLVYRLTVLLGKCCPEELRAMLFKIKITQAKGTHSHEHFLSCISFTTAAVILALSRLSPG